MVLYTFSIQKESQGIADQKRPFRPLFILIANALKSLMLLPHEL